MRLNPVLEGLRTYPFVRLTEAKQRLRRAGVDVVDFGVGEPREETPAFIRRALADALEPMSTYPLAQGLPELRAAIAAWARRRFGAALDPDTQIVPTLGSKEAIFHLAQVVGPGRVAVTTPGLPGAPSAARCSPGARSSSCRCSPSAASCPTSTRCPDDLALLWLNYPNNPTAATAPAGVLRARGRAGPRARVRPGQRRGLLRALLRGRGAGARALALGDLRQRPRRQHAVQALVDARLPLRLRGGRPACSSPR